MSDRDHAEPSHDEEIRSVGRGALYLTATKFWFLISGYVIYFGLPRLLGSGEAGKALFGKYSVVTGAAAIINALVIQGTTQAVSRFVGMDPSSGDGVRRAAYRLQAALGGSFFLLFFVSAPWLAASVYGDLDLTLPLRCASFITLFYSFYAVFMGYLNGRRLFARQAIVDFSYSTLKIVGVLGGAVLLSGSLGKVAGPVAGFAAAAGVVMLLGYLLCGRARGPGTTTVRSLLLFQTFTMLFTLVTTWIARGDLQILKVVLKGTEGVDRLAGEYAGAQAFATIPYQAVFAITFVLFPLVSGVAGRDPERLRGYVSQTTRWAAIIATVIVSLFVACPERTMTILFPAEYAAAAGALRILALGYLAYSLQFIMCAIVTASGSPSVSLRLVTVTGLIQAMLGVTLAKPLGMTGVALGTGAGMMTGCVLSHVVLLRRFGRGLSGSVLARTLGVGAAVGLAAHFGLARTTLLGGTGLIADVGGTGIVAKLLTLIGFGVLGMCYIGGLFATGVLDHEDRSKFGKVLRRG